MILLMSKKIIGMALNFDFDIRTFGQGSNFLDKLGTDFHVQFVI